MAEIACLHRRDGCPGLALKTVRVVEFGARRTALAVTHGSGRRSQVLRSMGLKDLDPDNRKVGKTAAEWHIQNPGPFFNDLQAKPANLGWMVEMAGKFFTLGLDSPGLAVEEFCSQLVTFAAETPATDSIFTFPSPFVIAF